MEELHHQIALDEAQFQYFLNSIANGDSSSSSSTPYVYYNDLPLSQTTMGADTYHQMYDTPENHHSYSAPSASLSPSMPPSAPEDPYYSSQPIPLSSSMPPSNYHQESYTVDQSTSDALAQAAMALLGPMPNIAPADNAHQYDGDGDFFGRGKDNFVGFTAKTEE